jgi:DnaJ-class molecular chaperone
MEYYEKYLKYKTKYIELQNQFGGKGWRKDLTEDEIQLIINATKKMPSDEAKKVKNQMAAQIHHNKKERKRLEKIEEERKAAASASAASGNSRASSSRPFGRSANHQSDQEITIKHLAVLGLNLQTANKDSIKRAYRRLAMKFHPDKSESASESPETLANQEKFKAINNANEYLNSLPEYQQFL